MDYLQYFKEFDIIALVKVKVLNLIINGLPSILMSDNHVDATHVAGCFKPYYKWITFNT